MNIKMSYTLRSVAFITLVLSPLFFLFSGCGEDKPTMVAKETLKISNITVSVTEAKPKESIVRYSITARQWQFSPATIRVTEGDKVILTIRSVDVPHGFGLDAFGINKVLNPGKDVAVEFIAKKKGEYPFVCTVPCGAGHANMKGMLIVEKKE